MAFLPSLLVQQATTSHVVIAYRLPNRALHLQSLVEASIQTSLPTIPSLLSFSIEHGKNTFSPFMLSCIAGASTSLGALIVFFIPKSGLADGRHDDQQPFLDYFLSFSLSLAASVMITVSVVSILPEALDGVFQYTNWKEGIILSSPEQLSQRILSFAVGCLAYFLISMVLSILPEPDSIFRDPKSVLPNDVVDAVDQLEKNHTQSTVVLYPLPSDGIVTTLMEDDVEAIHQRRLASWRMTMLIFVSLLLHNAPEGLAVAASAVESNQLGLIVTIGIMMHNIPEGLAIAVPCIVAEPDRPWLAFALATISGLAEPIGALIALQLLHIDSENNTLPMGNILAAVAGIMCMVSIRELYPEAIHHTPQMKKDNNTTCTNYSSMLMGTIFGMGIMIATELLLVPR